MDKETIGIISGVIVILSGVSYDFRVWQRKITPSLTSWSLWAFISFVLLLNFKSSGAESNIWPAVFGLLSPILVTAILIAHHEGFERLKKRTDQICVFLCLVSLLMWVYMNNDQELVQYALYVSIVADAFAAIPTFLLYLKNPELDRPLMWILFAIGYGISMFAIKEHTIANYSLPVYMTITAIVVAVPLVRYRVVSSIPFREWV
jgi:hypothetical protein